MLGKIVVISKINWPLRRSNVICTMRGRGGAQVCIEERSVAQKDNFTYLKSTREDSTSHTVLKQDDRNEGLLQSVV